mgnify:CR=1 FL=1
MAALIHWFMVTVSNNPASRGTNCPYLRPTCTLIAHIRNRLMPVYAVICHLITCPYMDDRLKTRQFPILTDDNLQICRSYSSLSLYGMSVFHDSMIQRILSFTKLLVLHDLYMIRHAGIIGFLLLFFSFSVLTTRP